MMTMAKINKLWHAQHAMPKNPSLQQRMDWHLAHNKECNCRPIPQGILKALQNQAQNPSA